MVIYSASKSSGWQKSCPRKYWRAIIGWQIAAGKCHRIGDCGSNGGGGVGVGDSGDDVNSIKRPL